ncbi:hypothetical protein [Nonomuraea dietziae]|uniref:hypothetical protein n=1 Tax=Nonomuraea dietziae TaxID=65515 RepID=UPI0031D8D89A
MDAALGALLGTLAGIAVFQALRPALAGVAITGSRFFPDMVAPTALQYAAVVAGVPLAAAGAALWSLRRVRITPLGAAREVRASAPGWWRVLPLLAGLGLFAGPVFAGGDDPNAVLLDVGLALIMVGLVVAGPWLTMLAARLAARVTSGAATLLAAQRLAADPKSAFRSVNGIVLAVFIGTAVAGIVPRCRLGPDGGGRRHPEGGHAGVVLVRRGRRGPCLCRLARRPSCSPRYAPIPASPCCRSTAGPGHRPRPAGLRRATLAPAAGSTSCSATWSNAAP